LSVSDGSDKVRHKSVETTHQEGAAVIHVNNPPVNALSEGVPQGIRAAIEAAEGDASVRPIVLLGAGKMFIAGANIKQLEDREYRKPVSDPEVLNLIRTSARVAGIAQRGFTSEQIVERVLCRITNQGRGLWRKVMRKGPPMLTLFTSTAMDFLRGGEDLILRAYPGVAPGLRAHL
jgi:hypothetical protein